MKVLLTGRGLITSLIDTPCPEVAVWGLCVKESCAKFFKCENRPRRHMYCYLLFACVCAETNRLFIWEGLLVGNFECLKCDQRQKLPQRLTAALEPISNAKAFLKQLYDLWPSHTPDHLAQVFGILV